MPLFQVESSFRIGSRPDAAAGVLAAVAAFAAFGGGAACGPAKAVAATASASANVIQHAGVT